MQAGRGIQGITTSSRTLRSCLSHQRPSSARIKHVIVGQSRRPFASRAYATEATAIPRGMLLRSKPPPSPTTQAQHPESASKVDQIIDSMLVEFQGILQQKGIECASVPTLYQQLGSNASKMMDEELPYEDTPSEDRKIKCTTSVANWLNSCQLAQSRFDGNHVANIEDDGLVLVSHVVMTEEPRTSWSLGFVITAATGKQYVVSCSHTLESAAHYYRSVGAASSSTFFITRTGHVFPMTALSTSLPLHDIAVYSFSPSSATATAMATGDKPESLHSVPVGLHPPQVGLEQALFLVGNDEWKKCKVVGYKDPRGNDAEPGTYDELNSLSIDVLPTPGSSGGPLVSSSGAVTGLVRGSRMAFGDRRSTGFATPAEKIFELFQLPGLGHKKDGPAGAGMVHHY